MRPAGENGGDFTSPCSHRSGLSIFRTPRVYVGYDIYSKPNCEVTSRRRFGAQLSADNTEHLNTPRLVADSTSTSVWKWDQAEPFGVNTPNGDPGNTGTEFDLPLRLPGQYFDKETGLHQNRFRDFDPGLGRYGESDPIGLKGGLNTYTYVGGRPLVEIDPLGLCDAACQRAAGLPPDTIRPPQATFTLGLGMTLFAGTAGGLGEWGIARDYKGNMCFYYQECRGRGAAGGLCAQAGINVGIQKGAIQAGTQSQAGLFVAGGKGLGADIQVMSDPDGNVSLVKGGPPPFSFGLGIAGGFVECTTQYVCPFSKK